MQQRQILKSFSNIVLPSRWRGTSDSYNTSWWFSLLTLLTISTVLIMSLTINSAFAYPVYSHSKVLPHRSVIYFAPTEDSVVKDF